MTLEYLYAAWAKRCKALADEIARYKAEAADIEKRLRPADKAYWALLNDASVEEAEVDEAHKQLYDYLAHAYTAKLKHNVISGVLNEHSERAREVYEIAVEHGMEAAMLYKLSGYKNDPRKGGDA